MLLPTKPPTVLPAVAAAVVVIPLTAEPILLLAPPGTSHDDFQFGSTDRGIQSGRERQKMTCNILYFRLLQNRQEK
jgi:hypothetical protein